MFATVRSSCVVGIDALSVDVEVNVRSGQPRFSIIGLGGAAVRESRERILSALEFSGYQPPDQILVNLAPAEVKKESAAFDLPIAVAIAVAMGCIPAEAVREAVLCGELSLTGEIKHIPGVVAHTLVALGRQMKRIYVPVPDAIEAGVIGGIEIVPVSSLAQVFKVLCGEDRAAPVDPPKILPHLQRSSFDDVIGQRAAKRALAVAAAGGHNILMIGPPGCGKSMLAERLPALLTPLSVSEKLEVIKIHSVAGQPTHEIIQGVRPFRAPHHVISEAGLIGGGTGPRPGEISLAHRGVLFLDEFPEFRRFALESLRAPLESGWVQLARARAAVQYPARFQLVAAMNPCPCGMFGSKRAGCRCSQYAVRDYLGKLSQPILDRIDLHVQLESVEISALLAPALCADESHEVLAARIRVARERQLTRYGCLNSEVRDSVLREDAALTISAKKLLLEATGRLGMSARGFTRVLRVARTLSDMEDTDALTDEAIAEAVSYRWLERLANVVHEGHSLRRAV